jgi:GntR family transcriptional regulator
VLDPAIPMPLYAQLAARLRGQIAEGVYRPGQRIPSEHELAAGFGVGRPTVRQATEMLVRERLLSRLRGSGTYVREAPPDVDLFSEAGTLSSFAKQGIRLEARILGPVRRRRVARGAVQPFAGRTAYFVTRRGAVRGLPVLLEEMYFDPVAFPRLDKQALSGRSLSQMAKERFFLKPTRASQRFFCCALDARRAESLELPVGAPVLKIERTVDFEGAPAALFAELYCRTDGVAFSQTISLRDPPPSDDRGSGESGDERP